ncbi:MAG: response regulator [Actinomycetota bacterium]
MEPHHEDVLRRFRHDVRSPLNVVLGFAVMLADELDGDQAESAEHIRRAAEQLLALVEGLPGGDPAATQPRGPTAPDRQPEAVDRPDGDVVLIEDNASNIRLVERILAHRPDRRLTTLADLDGVERWLAANGSAPMVVLLDRHLGGLDGLDLIESIRAVHDGVRVVVVTADATELAREEAMAAGADDVVTKPFSVAGLLEVVDQSSVPTAGSKR